MSAPEWMQKFKEIGMKGEPEIVSYDRRSSAVIKIDNSDELSQPTSSIEEKLKQRKQEQVGGSQPTDFRGVLKHKEASDNAPTSTETTGGEPSEAEDDAKVGNGEEDAAALFKAAGGAPTETKSDAEVGGGEEDAAALFRSAGGEPSEPKGDEKPVENEDDAAALFSAAGGTNDEKTVEDEEDAAALFHASGGAPAEAEDDENEDDVLDEVDVAHAASWVPSEKKDDEKDEEDTADKEVPSGQDEGGQKSLFSTTNDDEVGEGWVVDQTEFVEEEVVTDDNEHYEEVYVDEDGNEVVERIEEDRVASNEVPSVVSDKYEDISVEESASEPEGGPVVNRSVVSGDTSKVQSKPPYDPETDVENQRKILQKTPRGKRSQMTVMMPFLIFAILAGFGFLLGFFVFSDNGDDRNGPSPTLAPTPLEYLPLNPTSTGSIEVASTTPLDEVQRGNCNFDQLNQPHVIDQCDCFGEISILAEDVRVRYDTLVRDFIPNVFDDFDESISSCSYRNQALVWLSTGINNGGEAEFFVRNQRYALAYFFLEQGGLDWIDYTNWLSSKDVCQWDRISCDGNRKIRGIDLNRNDVSGQLSDAISLLDDLETFSVSRNDVVGTIPPKIFKSNSLKYIDLSYNAFFGSIPRFQLPILETLNLASNNLSGEIQPNIEGAKLLQNLDVSSNALRGSVPVELFRLPLKYLSLESNQLTGIIPEGISKASSLTHLVLGPNNFTGEIPSSLGALSNLIKLSIRDVPDLGGILLDSWGFSLTNLVELEITNTDVRGNIPEFYGEMDKLLLLDFSNNSLRGELPTELGLLTNLKKMLLDQNAFTGTIPSHFGNLAPLTELLVHTNELTGEIPSEFGKLINLETLTLDGNFMAGRAPSEVCGLRSEKLDEFIVDCPDSASNGVLTGTICDIPRCCTECI